MKMKLSYLAVLVVCATVQGIWSCSNVQEVKFGESYFSVRYQNVFNDSPSNGILGSGSNIKVRDDIRIQAPLPSIDFTIEKLCMEVKNAESVQAIVESADPGPIFRPDGSCSVIFTAIALWTTVEVSGNSWQNVCLDTNNLPFQRVSVVNLDITKKEGSNFAKLKNLHLVTCFE